MARYKFYIVLYCIVLFRETLVPVYATSPLVVKDSYIHVCRVAHSYNFKISNQPWRSAIQAVSM